MDENMLKRASLFLIISLIFPPLAQAFQDFKSTTNENLGLLEKSFEGRLGVFAWDSNTDQIISYHGNERFPLCSTSKLLVVSAILKKSESSTGLLKKKIIYAQTDLVDWSPITGKNFKNGLSISELCRAALRASDNTAANLLIKQVGGPRAVTQFASSIGDVSFNLTDCEPALNKAKHGDSDNTSTPKAMAESMRKLVLGDVLVLHQRSLLKGWLIESTNNEKRIRAAVRDDWLVADKTGTCGCYGALGDIAVIWPKDKNPIVMALYFSAEEKNVEPADSVIAKAAKLVLEDLKAYEE